METQYRDKTGKVHYGGSCEEQADRQLSGKKNQMESLNDRVQTLQREQLTLSTQGGGGEYSRQFRSQGIQEEIGRMQAELNLLRMDYADERQQLVSACEMRKVQGNTPEYQGRGIATIDQGLMNFAMSGR